ncbi:MAG: hypothetical protein IKP35_00920 [Alphaproteobacteria bacterium]|nr:hypothetical protein [Alphaproteobacteria bacterium]
MASILSGWGALAADGDTIIASKAYVDAMDATKQNKLTSTGANANINIVDSTGNNTGNVITNIAASDGTVTVTKGNISASNFVKNTDTVGGVQKTNVLEFDNDSDHAPSITAVKNMKTTTVRATGAVDTLVPTEAAVRNAINTAASNTSDAITGQFETDVNIEDEESTNAAHNVVADTEDPNLIPRNYNIQKGIMYLNGAGIENHYSENDNEPLNGDAITADQSWTQDPSETSVYKVGNMDDYVPTMAAVEARVKEAENSASSEYADKSLSNINSSGNGVIDGRIDTKINALDVGLTSGTTGVTMGGTAVSGDIGKVVVSVQEQDGLLTNVALGQAGTAGIADSAVTSAKIADGTIMNADINSSAAIDFSKMGAGLSSVNVSGGNYSSSCTAANPCVLTYFDGHYEWTAMDTENVSAVN